MASSVYIGAELRWALPTVSVHGPELLPSMTTYIWETKMTRRQRYVEFQECWRGDEILPSDMQSARKPRRWYQVGQAESQVIRGANKSVASSRVASFALGTSNRSIMEKHAVHLPSPNDVSTTSAMVMKPLVDRCVPAPQHQLHALEATRQCEGQVE